MRWLKFLGVYIVLEYAITAVIGWPGFFQVLWTQYNHGVRVAAPYAAFFLLTPALLVQPFHIYAAWYLLGC